MDQIVAEEEVDGGTADLVGWTLTDHLNTVRDIAKYDPLTDTTTVVNHLVYDAFGRVTSESNPAVDSLFLFTARPFDLDTGLQNNLNRWYDPRVGRWLSEDPIGFNAGDENLYRYAGNGPVDFVDPLGLWIGPCTACLRPTPIPMPIRPIPVPVRPVPPIRPLPPTNPILGPKPPLPPPFPFPSPRPDYPPLPDAPPQPGPFQPGTPKPPGEEMCPPGDCSEAEYHRLRQEVVDKCKSPPPPVCTGNTLFVSCAELDRRREAWNDCFNARYNLDTKCFRGGDEGHQYQRKWAAYHRDMCEYKYHWWNCAGSSYPNWPGGGMEIA
ncbi:RHS repeat-associated core domain-containing protein [Thermopirellula anaerolimosa]